MRFTGFSTEGPVILDRPKYGKAWRGDRWIKIELASVPRVQPVTSRPTSPLSGNVVHHPPSASIMADQGSPDNEKAMSVGVQSIWTSALDSDSGSDENDDDLPLLCRILELEIPEPDADHDTVSSTSLPSSLLLSPSPLPADAFDDFTREESESIRLGSSFIETELDGLILRIARKDIL
jgi:hypothetical protein